MALTIKHECFSKALYDETITYLRRSAVAVTILDDLQGLGVEIIVQLCAFGVQSRYEPPDGKYGPQGGKVFWNVYDWTKVQPDAETITYSTPSIALIHELGHAYQYFHFPKYAALIKKGRRCSAAHTLEVETHNLLNHERRVALELDEPARQFYTESIHMDAREQQLKGLQFS